MLTRSRSLVQPFLAQLTRNYSENIARTRKKKGYTANALVDIKKRFIDREEDVEKREEKAYYRKMMTSEDFGEFEQITHGVSRNQEEGAKEAYNTHTAELRARIVRKHFKDIKRMQKEVSLLTWAEKEKIKYLYRSNPEEFTPEVISNMFPISSEGVHKLVKSNLKLRSHENIEDHDQRVMDRIEQIKNGEIPITPELKLKMEIRENLPYMKSTNEDETALVESLKPKKLGPFARIVASPEEILQSDELERQERLKAEANDDDEQENNVDDEEEEGAYKLEKEDSRYSSQLSHLGFAANEYVTLGEFEKRVKASNVEVPADVEYLVQRNKEVKSPYTAEDDSIKSDPMKPSDGAYFHLGKIEKFKKKDDDLKFENKEPFKYSKEIGYEKPFLENKDTIDQKGIKISNKSKSKVIPGSVYRVGDSYFDEDGSFLYKVV